VRAAYHWCLSLRCGSMLAVRGSMRYSYKGALVVSGTASHSMMRGLQYTVRRSSTFYDSQSGRTVTVPTSVQIHLGLTAVATDRVSSALRHLLSDGKPVKGLASVLGTVVSDEAGVAAAAATGQSEVLITVADHHAGVAAMKAAGELSLRGRALLRHEICSDPYNVQITAAELADAGAEALLLTVGDGLDQDDLCEIIDMACEVDVLGAPMRSRLGLCIRPAGAEAVKLAQFAHKELELLHFYCCLGGKEASRPTELLTALGVKKPDMAYGALMLAEFVPDAA